MHQVAIFTDILVAEADVGEICFQLPVQEAHDFVLQAEEEAHAKGAPAASSGGSTRLPFGFAVPARPRAKRKAAPTPADKARDEGHEECLALFCKEVQ